MPQFLVLAAIGGGAYLGARWLKRKFKSVQRDFASSVNKAQERQRTPRQSDAQTMEYDSKTGVYHIEED